MQMSTRLLSLAIATVLAVPFSATAGRFDASPAAQRALGLINAAPGAVRHNAGDSFVAKDVIVDANGTEHVRFDRTFRGMPVIGGDVVVHSRNGIIKSTSMTLGTSARPGINGRVSADQAILAAGTEFGTGFNAVSNAKKVVFARNMSPRLAYEVVFSGIRADQTPTEMHYFVDANSGQILDRWDGIETGKPGSGGGGTTCTGTAAAGTGNTLYSGSV
ncbi:MAG: PepSY domain-containing protein, partial [Thermomonas sp.]